jgi:hypothetical protein
MFAQEPIVPAQVFADAVSDAPPGELSTSILRLARVLDIVRTRQLENHEANRKNYNAKVKPLLLQEGDWVFKYRANDPSESGISRKTATYQDGPFQVQEILNDRQVKLRKSISGLGSTSKTITEIVSKDRLTRAHPWELSRLQTPFTWTIAKATKPPTTRPGQTNPSPWPTPHFNLTPSAPLEPPRSPPEPASDPVDDPEPLSIHPQLDDAAPANDVSIPMNEESEQRIAPKRKADALNYSLSPTRPDTKKLAFANDFASTMADATFHVSAL